MAISIPLRHGLIAKGDTWASIAANYGATVAQLKKWNPGLLKPGAFKLRAQILVPRIGQEQQSAMDLISQTLKSWGLATLIPDLKRLIIGGDTAPDTLSLKLAQTKAYQIRFAANKLRSEKGLPQLSPAEYIANEEQYYNIMHAYGLPAGFYDKHEDFTNFIANDTSPSEVEKRVQVAAQQYLNASPAQRQVWSQYFGLTQGDIVAHLLDPKLYSLQDLENKALQVQIGTAAKEQGLNIPQRRAQQFQEKGVTLAMAQKAYADIASAQANDLAIAHRFGTGFSQTEEENARLLSQGADINKLQSLYQEEEGLFQGRTGATPESLAPNLSNYL